MFGRDRVTIARIGAVAGLVLTPGVLGPDLYTAGLFSVADIPNVAQVIVGIIGLFLLILSGFSASGIATARRRALTWLVVAVVAAALYDFLNYYLRYGGFPISYFSNYVVLGLLPPVAFAAAVCGWLTLRGRPRRSYAAVGLLLLSVPLVPLFPGLPTWSLVLVIRWALYVVLTLAAVLLAGRISSAESKESRDQRIEGVRAQSTIEAQAVAIQQWQAAYALANPGQPIPAPPLTVRGDAYGAADRTNTMSILAIIFGFFIGILGIIFGHIALAQIRRTGEGGRGLAITGLVFGYVGVGLVLILVISDLAALIQFLATR
jgi:hypothetical protein